MKRVSDTLGVSRSHLSTRGKCEETSRGPYEMPGDNALLTRIRAVLDTRPSYGYRRVTARLNRDMKTAERCNHKRVYRVMHRAGLLLPKCTSKVARPHDGKVITLASNLRWCSDGFEIRCWNGERVHVAFSLDCCDREAISWVAAARHLDGMDIRDLMVQSVEARFGKTTCPGLIEWLSDNGPSIEPDDVIIAVGQDGLVANVAK